MSSLFNILSQFTAPRDFLVRIVWTLSLLVFCPIVGVGLDDPCEGLDPAKFAASLPRLSPVDLSQGKFIIREGRGRFVLTFVVRGRMVFKGSIKPGEGSLEISPINVGGYSALILTYASGGTSVFTNCHYIVLPSLRTGQFVSLEIGAVTQIDDINSDEESEIIVLESTELLQSNYGCFSNANTPYWRRIYHVDLDKAKLVDVSSQFPSYYTSLAQEYRRLLDELNGNPDSPAACKQVMSNLIRQADELGVVSSDAGPTIPLTQASSSGTIAFSSRRDGNQEVYQLDLATDLQTNLTRNPADDGYPKWSPDGHKIAFSTYRDGNWQVYIMNRDGAAQVNVTRNPHDTGYVDWSPDGQWLAFASNGYGPSREICTSSANGSSLKRLTNNSAEDVHPAWSPDGSKIAFASERDGNTQIYVMNANGTNPKRLTQNTWYDDYPSWSPDGSELAFASNRDSGDSHKLEIYVMGADGSNVRRVVSHPADDLHPTWSPDGKMLAFSSDRFGDRDIFIVNIDGSGGRRVVSSPGNDEHPHWLDSTRNANLAVPPEQTVSGFYWPLGKEQYRASRCGTWLGRDAIHGGCYFQGRYHLGVDMMANQGDPVYAIAEGQVIGMSTDGEGNAAAFIKHRLSDGTPFVAVYGHIRTTVNTANKNLVKGGLQFATVGSYSGGNHLHFAIRPGIGIPPTRSTKDQNGNIVQIGWGRASNWFWPDTNGFVEPISWINPTPTPEAAPKAPISGGVLNGRAISLPRPVYPPIARQAHASGTVVVQVTIDENGNVISARAVSGHPLLQAPAVSAAYAARFPATKLGGQPVKVTGVITYDFVPQ